MTVKIFPRQNYEGMISSKSERPMLLMPAVTFIEGPNVFSGKYDKADLNRQMYLT